MFAVENFEISLIAQERGKLRSVFFEITLLLWSPYSVYGIRQTIISLPCGFFFFFLSSPNLSRRRLDVCHTSTHGVALVRI